MTLLIMMVSLKQTPKQDLATADRFTRKARGSRRGCAWSGGQDTSVRMGELWNCAHVALPTFYVISSTSACGRPFNTDLTTEVQWKRCPTPWPIASPNSSVSLHPCPLPSVVNHQILVASHLPISKPLWKEDPCHRCIFHSGTVLAVSQHVVYCVKYTI